jgi:uncharacterized iron-regulated protein
MPVAGRLVLVLALAAACAPAARPGAAASPAGGAHPLAGRIWDTAAARVLEEPALVEALARARFVLLGERHDHPGHHRLQARLVRALAAAGRRPALAFEMLAADQQPALARHLAAAPGDAAGLGDAVGWAQSGWPPWPLYEPIARAALDAGLPIVAADLPRGTARRLAREGAGAVDPALAPALGLDRALPAEDEADLVEEIRRAHCGHLDAGQAARMTLAQRARDAHLAARLVEAATADGAVLIAGAGHVRTDRGVPWHLRAIAPGAPVASVAFLEVRDAAAAPAAYGRLPFDYVWFTERLDDHDPCERFRKPLERLRSP